MNASAPQATTTVAAARPWWRRRQLAITLGVLAALALLIDVNVSGPRVHVRWAAEIRDDQRLAIERQYDLRDGHPVTDAPGTWRYELGDDSSDNLGALLRDDRVADTAYIARDTLSATDGQAVEIRVTYPFEDVLSHPRQLLQMQASLWLIVAGVLTLRGASATDRRRRCIVGVAAVALVTAVALMLPLDPWFVTMGGSADHVRSRNDFESWFGGRVRFEKHLSQMILLQVYGRLGTTDAAPEQALIALSRLATVWFLVSALTIGFIERWSPTVLRYLGLVLIAPATLLYFGWRELGYMSLSMAAFPLLLGDILEEDRDPSAARPRPTRLEIGSAFAGLGAAFHGSGLVGLAGMWLAAAGARGASAVRAARLLRSVAYGTAAYLGWIAIYIIVLKMQVLPDPGPTAVKSWRSLFVDVETAGRIVPAIFSTVGARDVLVSAWVAGVPLLGVALSLWRRHRLAVAAALWYLPPSVLFLIFRAPFDGIGVGVDLVIAGFPALFALAWVCAHDRRRTVVAAMLLVSAHYVIWRILLDERFQS